MPKKPPSQTPGAIYSRRWRKKNQVQIRAKRKAAQAKWLSTPEGRITFARSAGRYIEEMGAITLDEWATILSTSIRHRVAAKSYKGKVWHEDNIPSDLDEPFILELLKAACPRTSYVWREDIIIPELMRPSLDRIDSDGGYTKDNIQITTRQYNLAKSNNTDYDTIEMARAIVRTADARHGMVNTAVDIGIAPMQEHAGRWATT